MAQCCLRQDQVSGIVLAHFGITSTPRPPTHGCRHEPHFCLLRESGRLEAVLEAAPEEEEGAEDAAFWSPVRAACVEGWGASVSRPAGCLLLLSTSGRK